MGVLILDVILRVNPENSMQWEGYVCDEAATMTDRLTTIAPSQADIPFDLLVKSTIDQVAFRVTSS
jgi:hypothetical protein